MSIELARASAEAENRDELHLARLLILLRSADKRRKTEATKAQAVEGITKLAKLDFFLRYPTYLERALSALERDPQLVQTENRERHSIETAMVRFRYGPWDGRYRRWLGLLHARDLVTLSIQGNTVMIGLTERGRGLAEFISEQLDFQIIEHRSEIVASQLGKMSATKLKDFTYRVVPEITQMKWGETIGV
jgi:hypothetical protein